MPLLCTALCHCVRRQENARNVNSTRVKPGCLWVKYQIRKGRVHRHPVHQESCESLTLFPGLFSLKLGVLSECSNSDHFANKLSLRTDLRSQEWLACTFFWRNSLLRLVIRMQTIIQNTLMSIWCLGPKPPATPKPPPEPPVPTNGPPLPPGETVSYQDHWPSFKKDSWTTMANFCFKSSLL